MNSIFKKLFLGILVFTCIVHKGQQNKNYYLIDSVDSKSLSKQDKIMMDSILKLYYKAERDTTKLQLLDFLSNNCSQDLWPKYNDYIYSQAELILKNNKHLSPPEFRLIKGTSANCLVNKGSLISEKGDLDEAMALYQRGLIGFREAGDKLGESNTLSNIASLYVGQNKIDKAIDLMNKNIILLKELNNERALLNTYNNLGVVYRNQGELKKALEFFYKCLGLEKKNGETKLLCAVLLNIGTLHNSLKEIDSAVQDYNRCLEMSERIGYKVGVAKALRAFGSCFSG